MTKLRLLGVLLGLLGALLGSLWDPKWLPIEPKVGPESPERPPKGGLLIETQLIDLPLVAFWQQKIPKWTPGGHFGHHFASWESHPLCTVTGFRSHRLTLHSLLAMPLPSPKGIAAVFVLTPLNFTLMACDATALAKGNCGGFRSENG